MNDLLLIQLGILSGGFAALTGNIIGLIIKELRKKQCQCNSKNLPESTFCWKCGRVL